MRIAGTCGCFDLIHDGHISILQACRRTGDKTVVFINSDESINRLKGPHKPVLPLDARVAVLESIEYVDSVIPFHDDTPVQALERYFAYTPEAIGNLFWLKPAYDYAISGIPERELIQKMGGIILYYDSPIKRSSSKIIERIKSGTNCIDCIDW